MTEKRREHIEEPVKESGKTDEGARAANKPLSTAVKVFMWALGVVALFVLWFIICTVTQKGVSTSLWMLVKLALIVGGLLFVWRFIFVPSGKWPALGLGLAIAWVYGTGSYHTVLDIVLLVTTFIAVMLCIKEARNWMRALLGARTVSEGYQVIISIKRPQKDGGFKDLSPTQGFIVCVLFLAFFWGLSSTADGWLPSPVVPRDLANFTRLRERVDRESYWSDAHVGLALSGGGYRAVLMHAGVLDALERLNVPVTNISTVSGGSIIGAFYTTGGTPKQMLEAVRDGRFRFARSLTDAQNLLRLGFPFQVPGFEVKLFKWYEFSRSNMQANLLDSVLLGGETFAALNKAKAENPDAPELMVCSTDLHTGALLGFHRGGILRRHVQHPTEKLIYKGLTDEDVNDVPTFLFVRTDAGRREPAAVGAPMSAPSTGALPRLSAVTPVLTTDDAWLDTPLSHVVAASGAFPGAFNAMHEKVKVNNKGFEPQTLDLLLADGGITDNSALNIMEYARQKGREGHAGLKGWKDLTLVLSSDASALLSDDDSLTSLGELTRAIDIVYANIGSATWDAKLPKVMLSPAAYLDTRELGNSLNPDERRLLLKAQVAKAVDRSMAKLDVASLSLLAEAVTNPETRQALSDTRAELEAQQTYGTGGTGFVAMSPERWAGMRDEVVNEFADCSEVFLRTSTLTDNFEPGDADALFRLGQFLVVFNWPYIKEHLPEGSSPATVVAATQTTELAEQPPKEAAARPAPAARHRAGRLNAGAQPR